MKVTGTGGETADRWAVREVTIADIMTVLWRHRRMLVVLPVAFALLAVVTGLIPSRTYTSRAVFAPQDRSSLPSGLSGVAARLGFDLPSDGAGRSLAFYARLVQSEEVLRRVVEWPRDEGAGGSRGPDLVQFFGVDEDRRDVAVARTAQAVGDRVDVEIDPAAGVVTLEVTTRDPAVSAGIARRLLELAHRFEVESRRTQAGAEREFTGRRLEEAQRELAVAEDSLRQFLEANRRFENAPELRFRHDRLQRRVALQQEIVTSLAQAHERARIEEVRTTPVLTVVDPPRDPVRPDPRWLWLRAVLGLLVGTCLAVLVLSTRAFLRQVPSDGDGAIPELKRSLESVWDRLPWAGPRTAGEAEPASGARAD